MSGFVFVSIEKLRNAEFFSLPHSYYSVIARSYLRKQNAGVKEVSARAPEFRTEVVPKIGRGIIPVLRLTDGTVIQDSLDIIEYGDSLGAALPAVPENGRLRVLAYLFFTYGSQALLKPAMHYRWTVYDQQSRFLDHAFGLGEGKAGNASVMDKMRSYLPILGVTPETIPAIEADYLELLSLLDKHLELYPYILGREPTLADYGMLGPLFGHLGRDPVPAGIMKAHAPNVFRWTERMNASVDDSPEFPDGTGRISPDDMPQTLVALISFIGRSYGPELEDRIGFIRNWLLENTPEDGAPVSEKPSQRAIGIAPVRYGGTECTVAIQPYLLYCQRRAEDAYAALTGADKDWAEAVLGEARLMALVTPNLTMTVGRANNIEVWNAL